MNAKGEKSKERIDLGLGAILAALDGAKEVEVSIDLTDPRPKCDPSTWTLGETPTTPKGEFDLLADERRWSEIVRRTETRLADKSDIDARLWWLRGHLGAFSMPVSFLAAPLESLCRDIKEQELRASLKSLLEETGLLVLGRLEDVGDKSAAEAVRAALESVGVRQPRGSNRRQRVGTSSFRAIESTPLAGEPAVAPPTEKDRSPVVVKSTRKRFIWTSVCVVVVASLLTLDRLFPYVRSPTQGIASESFIRAPLDIELSRPVPERREPGGRLGALFYSLEGEGGSSSSARTAEALPMAKPAGDSSQPNTDISTQGSLPSGDAGVLNQERPAQRESVNTDGPVEGADFRDGLNRDRPVPQSSRREELRGGPPQAVLPGQAPQGFEDQKTYRVLARTSVLSAPSYGGRVIGQLDRGDRVLVEGKLGRWLRLRSKKGRGGYVIAADVEEVPDL